MTPTLDDRINRLSAELQKTMLILIAKGGPDGMPSDAAFIVMSLVIGMPRPVFDEVVDNLLKNEFVTRKDDNLVVNVEGISRKILEFTTPTTN